MISPCEIPQLDIPDVGRNHILFSRSRVRISISVQEIYSDSLFLFSKNEMFICRIQEEREILGFPLKVCRDIKILVLV